MITMDIAGLILIIGLTVFATCVIKDPADWFDDWDEFMKGGWLHDIKQWFRTDFFGTK